MVHLIGGKRLEKEYLDEIVTVANNADRIKASCTLTI
jgi:hypothetical protein